MSHPRLALLQAECEERPLLHPRLAFLQAESEERLLLHHKSMNTRLFTESIAPQIHNNVVWRSGRATVWINEVNLRRARLVLGWVTVFGWGSIPVPDIYLGM